jgi:hypothetical protein
MAKTTAKNQKKGMLSQLQSNRSFQLKVISVIIVILLIAVGVGLYLFLQEEPEEEIVDVGFEIDDQISPLVNQGLVLEVLRVRHRGIRELLQTRGNAWKTPPTFYFISTMDGLEYISKDVAQHAESTEVFFNTWDSMFQENKVVKDAVEEQETSDITLQIVESVPSGILGLRSNDVVKEEFSVTYDYRTGRWTGDDWLMDDDGYGYYLGDTFEIWFNL